MIDINRAHIGYTLLCGSIFFIIRTHNAPKSQQPINNTIFIPLTSLLQQIFDRYAEIIRHFLNLANAGFTFHLEIHPLEKPTAFSSAETDTPFSLHACFTLSYSTITTSILENYVRKLSIYILTFY